MLRDDLEHLRRKYLKRPAHPVEPSPAATRGLPSDTVGTVGSLQVKPVVDHQPNLETKERFRIQRTFSDQSGSLRFGTNDAWVSLGVIEPKGFGQRRRDRYVHSSRILNQRLQTIMSYYTAIPYHTIPYHIIPYHAIPCIPYHTIPYHTVAYHTITIP